MPLRVVEGAHVAEPTTFKIRAGIRRAGASTIFPAFLGISFAFPFAVAFATLVVRAVAGVTGVAFPSTARTLGSGMSGGATGVATAGGATVGATAVAAAGGATVGATAPAAVGGAIAVTAAVGLRPQHSCSAAAAAAGIAHEGHEI